MSWRVAHQMTIYRSKDWYSAHPAILRCPDGSLLVFFHRSPAHGYSRHSHPLFDIRLCRSTDEGVSWSRPQFVTSDPRGGILDFGAHCLPNDDIYIHGSTVELVPERSHPQAHWISKGGIPFWTRSSDHGRTWSDPVRFPQLPDTTWGHPASHSGVCRSGLLAMPDGRLLLPGKSTCHPEGIMPFFGMMQCSMDMGETWQYEGPIAQDDIAHFSEPAITMTPGGRIMVLFRCHPHSRNTSQELYLAYVESNDGGETWSSWRPTTIHGCPGHILTLKDGRLFVTVGTRWPGQQGCLARVLTPEGEDIDTAPDIVIRGDSFDPDCGYPWSVELNNGNVLVIYYYVNENGVRGIEGTIVEDV